MPATPVQPAFGDNRLVDAAFTPASHNCHDGCLPAVDIAGVAEKKTAQGTSYVPQFKISGWVPRPPELPLAGIPVAQWTKPAAAKPTASFVRPVKDSMDDEIPF